MTTLAYTPKLAAALADGSLSAGLSDAKLDTLKRIHEQITALIVPLTSVQSLPVAEELAASLAPEYAKLVVHWSQTLPVADALKLNTDEESPLIGRVGESGLLSNAAKEQLHGALESSKAYFDWFSRVSLHSVAKEQEDAIAAIVVEVRDRVAQAEMAFIAVGLILEGTPGSTPQAIPILAELADRCWTEVEDVFLGLTEYDNGGEIVSLDDVKAELGL